MAIFRSKATFIQQGPSEERQMYTNIYEPTDMSHSCLAPNLKIFIIKTSNISKFSSQVHI